MFFEARAENGNDLSSSVEKKIFDENLEDLSNLSDAQRYTAGWEPRYYPQGTSAKYSPYSENGIAALNLTANPLTREGRIRTALLLGRSLESNKNELANSKIGFSVTLCINESGNDIAAFAGFCSKGQIADFFVGGIAGFSDPALGLTFTNGSIKFQNQNISSYVPNDWYTIEVILDRPRTWECYVLLQGLTTAENRNGTIRGATDFNGSTNGLVSYFYVGFDGVEPTILIQDVSLFHFLPSLEMHVQPNAALVQAGNAVNFTVNVTTSAPYVLSGMENDSYFKFYLPDQKEVNSSSVLLIDTSSDTPPGTYQINVTARSRENQDVTQTCNVNVIVTSPPVPLWGQLLFWPLLVLGAITFSTSFALVKARGKLKAMGNEKSMNRKDKRPCLTCINPDCGFQEVPIDSRYCPVCGKPVDRK